MNSYTTSKLIPRENISYKPYACLTEFKKDTYISSGDVGFPKLKTIDVAQLLQTKSVYVSGMMSGKNLFKDF